MRQQRTPMRERRQSVASVQVGSRATRRTRQDMAITKALRRVVLLSVLSHLAFTARSRVAPHTGARTGGLEGDLP
jgi:hypothetical protein